MSPPNLTCHIPPVHSKNFGAPSWSLAGLVLLCCCGSHSAAEQNATGIMLNQSGTSIALTASCVLRTGNDAELYLNFANTTEDLCAQFNAVEAQKNTYYLNVGVSTGSAGGSANAQAASAPGTYTNIDGELTLSSQDSNSCVKLGTTEQFDKSNQVIISDIGSTTTPTKGSLDIKLVGGGTITGSFSSQPCVSNPVDSTVQTCH